MNPHSAAQFGEQRDFWWHPDFLDLMARRWNLSAAHSLADIGCGKGHWTSLLSRYLGAGSAVVGIDREQQWLQDARERFRATDPESVVTFLKGDAYEIPLSTGHFDVVTCQTLLMHLSDPQRALTEMIRIARPGGLVICVEPNNLFNVLYLSSLTVQQPVEELLQWFEIWLRYQRGKIANGGGDNSIGDQLPGLFAQSGLTNITIYQSDRAAPLFPPYDTREQRVLIKQEDDWANSNSGPWDDDEFSSNILAGSGSRAFLKEARRVVREEFRQRREAMQGGRFHTAGGALQYLVSGTKA